MEWGCVSGVRSAAHGRVKSGGRVTLVGLSLGVTRSVVFLGGRGRSDDVSQAVRPVDDESLVVKVPGRGLTLILLANGDGLVRPLPLAAGDLTISPVGRLFLGTFVR